MSTKDMHDHDHDSDPHAGHAPAEVAETTPSYYEVMETAVRELLIEKGLIKAADIHRQIDVINSRTLRSEPRSWRTPGSTRFFGHACLRTVEPRARSSGSPSMTTPG